MNRSFFSVTGFMNRLRYPYKFTLIGTLLIVPMCISGYLLVSDANEKLQFAVKERQGLEYHRTLLQFNDLLSQRRLMWLAEDQSEFAAIISNTDKELKEKGSKLAIMQTQMRDYLRMPNEWSKIYEQFNGVLKMNTDIHTGLLYVAYSEVMANNGYFMYGIGNASGLKNDSNRGPNELGPVVLEQIPLVLSQLDSLVGLAIYGTEAKEINAEQQVRVHILSGLNNDILAEIGRSVELGATYFADEAGTSNMRMTAKRWASDARTFSEKMKYAFNDDEEFVEVPEGLILEGSQAMMTGYQLYYQAMGLIEDSIKQREISLERGRNLTIALLFVLVGIAVTLFLAVSLSVMRSVKMLQRTSLEIAAGNLNARVKLDTKDELKSVEIAFNESIRYFGELLEQKNEMESKITRQAHYDMLTDLPNRFLFYEKFRSAIARLEAAEPESRSTGIGLLYVDLNGFKPVNDRYGHHVGDGLLREVASRLRQCEPEEDAAARIGGDEFTIIVPNGASEGEAERLADRIAQELQRTFVVDGNAITISGSIGIAIYPRDGNNVDALIQHADKAMYRDKRNRAVGVLND
ncbi:GGDEF domain-containing protein [Cohnella herbarum]|uniref:Diguanylate cyclase n=1 Tax=Cohnella herbarum TaxID=2728023 RepID=A0A7Z2ZM39_9BACL|nr:GGDEF domain-containing protein [Cohnella herbarum]QJD84574.1 diguanylate cyclase [Cohnella herbarum]